MKAVQVQPFPLIAVPAGNNTVVESQPSNPPSFLLGPGGQDYVGCNSYDASPQGNQE